MKRYKYNIEDIKKLAKQMIVLVDSREKKNSHILDYFRKQKISFQTEKLEYGDHSFMIPAVATGKDIYFHWDCVVERKASLEELSSNLAQERERFEKEFLKAANDGAKIYLMIGAPGGYFDIIGHKYRAEFTPAAYMASLKIFEHRFDANIQFIYSSQQKSGMDEMRLKMERIVEKELGYTWWFRDYPNIPIQDLWHIPKPRYMRWEKYESLLKKFRQLQKDYEREFWVGLSKICYAKDIAEMAIHHINRL